MNWHGKAVDMPRIEARKGSSALWRPLTRRVLRPG